MKAVNDLLIEKGLDVPIHVDAASGGFVAPFVVPELEWDFRLEKVRTTFILNTQEELELNGVRWYRSMFLAINMALYIPALGGRFGVQLTIYRET